MKLTFFEVVSIVLGTILGIFFLLPIAFIVFSILVFMLSPFLVICLLGGILAFIVWAFCKIFKLPNPINDEQDIQR